MAMYDSLAETILRNIGGASNIDTLTHCITRPRFVVKDDSKVHVEALNATSGVADTLKSLGQHQVIIGMHVPDVYNAVCKAAHIETAAPKEVEPVKQSLFHRFVGVMTSVFAPFLRCHRILRCTERFFAAASYPWYS